MYINLFRSLSFPLLSRRDSSDVLMITENRNMRTCSKKKNTVTMFGISVNGIVSIYVMFVLFFHIYKFLSSVCTDSIYGSPSCVCVCVCVFVRVKCNLLVFSLRGNYHRIHEIFFFHLSLQDINRSGE